MLTTSAATTIPMITTTYTLMTILGIRTTMVMSVALPIHYKYRQQTTLAWSQPKFRPATH